MFELCDFFLLAALTPVHVGVGRSPGAVDLPVARDGLGLPFIPASGIKGSVKSTCLRLLGNGCDRVCERGYGWDLRFSERVEEEYASPIVFTDGFLLFYPVRVEASEGFGYGLASSCTLLSRAHDLLSLCNKLGACCDAAGEVETLLEYCNGAGSGQGEAYFNNIPVSGNDYVYARDAALSLLSGTTSLVERLAENTYIFTSDEAFLSVVEAGILRQTRVRLDYKKKTVEEGGLWTEEYVSQGAVFYTASLYRSIERAMGAEQARRLNNTVLRETGHVLTIGGKETIGKGIMLVKNPGCGDTYDC